MSAAIAIKLISCEELRGQSRPEPMDLQAEGDSRTNLQKESDARAVAGEGEEHEAYAEDHNAGGDQSRERKRAESFGIHMIAE